MLRASVPFRWNQLEGEVYAEKVSLTSSFPTLKCHVEYECDVRQNRKNGRVELNSRDVPT